MLTNIEAGVVMGTLVTVAQAQNPSTLMSIIIFFVGALIGSISTIVVDRRIRQERESQKVKKL